MSDSIIRTAVDGFVQKGFMFTAYDVTKFLRKAGERVRHCEVNDIVKSMFANSEMGQYKREIKDIGSPVSPFVYAHTYSDVNDYDAAWVDTNPNQDGMKYDTTIASGASTVGAYVPLTSGVTAPVAPVAPKAPKVSLPIGVYKVTSEGRLNIPVSVVNNIGWLSRQNVGILMNKIGITVINDTTLNDKIVLDPNPSAAIGETVKINSDGRIRLGRSTLDQISCGDLFKIDMVGQRIEVIPA
jgi:hypothetical protein